MEGPRLGRRVGRLSRHVPPRRRHGSSISRRRRGKTERLPEGGGRVPDVQIAQQGRAILRVGVEWGSREAGAWKVRKEDNIYSVSAALRHSSGMTLLQLRLCSLPH